MMKRAALVTGGGSGIGRGVALALARRGVDVVLVGRRPAPLDAVVCEVVALGARGVALPADLARDDDRAEVLGRARAALGRIDILVHSAGALAGGELAALSLDEIERAIAVNLLAPIALTRLLLPDMLARRRGAIVFVASVAGQIALPGSVIYSTTKFGLRGFALGLRREVAWRGVGVSIVSPGFVDTAMAEEMRYIPKARPETVARVIADMIERPRREVFVPGYYRLFVWLDRLLPGLIDIVLRQRRLPRL